MSDQVESKKGMALTIRERVFIEQYIHIGGKKPEAYALAFMESDFSGLDNNQRLTCRIKSTKAWAVVEEKLGGMSGVMNEMGIDDVSLIRETLRLTRLKRPMYLKEAQPTGQIGEDGVEIVSHIIWYDDSMAQAKGVEMLHKIRGSFGDFDRLNEEKKGSPLRLEFGNYGALADADNVQINIGKSLAPRKEIGPTPVPEGAMVPDDSGNLVSTKRAGRAKKDAK